MPTKKDTAMLNKLPEILSCTICGLALLEAVALPECMHVFCKDCLQEKNKKINCGKCNNQCQKSELVHIPIVDDILKAMYETGFADRDNKNFTVGNKKVVKKLQKKDMTITTTHESKTILKEKEEIELRRSVRIKRKHEHVIEKKTEVVKIDGKKSKLEKPKEDKLINEKDHIGKRVGIYWTGDKQKYCGKILSHNKKKGFRVKYDDGEIHYERYDPKKWTFEEKQVQVPKSSSTTIVIDKVPETKNDQKTTKATKKQPKNKKN